MKTQLAKPAGSKARYTKELEELQAEIRRSRAENAKLLEQREV